MSKSVLEDYFPGKPKDTYTVDISYMLDINNELIENIISKINVCYEEYKKIGLKKAVIGISGGVDSVIAAVLVEKSNIPLHAVVVEIENRNGVKEDTDFAIRMIKNAGIEYTLIDGTRAYDEHLGLIHDNSRLTRVHLRSRLITNIIFQFADQMSAFVIDTTDKSEDILKIYEESFRGHIAPLLSIYKSELHEIARYLGLNELPGRASGCPELVDIDAFGLDWSVLDPILHLIVNKKPIKAIADEFGIEIEWLRSLNKRIELQPTRTDRKTIKLPRNTTL